MSRDLIAASLLFFSFVQFFAFLVPAFPSVRMGAMLMLLVTFLVLTLVTFVNYIDSIKKIAENFSFVFDGLQSVMIGTAPGIFFGILFLVALVCGVYVGW